MVLRICGENGLVSMEPESLSLHRFVLAQSDADVTLKDFEALSEHSCHQSPPPKKKPHITSPFSPSLLDQHMALASGLFN